MGMNNIQQLTNILESIHPYLGAGGGQPQGSQVDPSQYMGNAGNGGTFFTQDANNGGYYSSNGHTINLSGAPGVGGRIHVAVDDDGNAQYYQYPAGGEDDDLLDEFPDDLDDGHSDHE